MNGVPMKLDYSKTINEQLDTFNYYKDRYACYELELIKDRKLISQLTNNWNELETWIKNYFAGNTSTIILDKMKEIKEGDINEENKTSNN